jgi:Fur family ferric uptake transcriptional regulator
MAWSQLKNKGVCLNLDNDNTISLSMLETELTYTSGSRHLLFKNRPMERSTVQRSAIREALQRAGRPLLAQEVLVMACESVPRIGIATIYRNLKTMVDEGLLRQVVLPGENPRFELSGHGHHHHFQCNQCQKVFDIHSCPTDLANLAPKGFTVEDHDLTLYGRCKNC